MPKGTSVSGPSRNKLKLKLFKIRLQQHEVHVSQWRAALFILVFAILGTYFLWHSFAATTSVTYSGQLSAKHPVASYPVAVGSTGTLTANATYTKLSNLKLDLLDKSGTVIATSTTTSPVTLTSMVTSGNYTVRLTGTGRGNYSVTLSYPIANTLPPTVSLSASPTTITTGGSATLTWSATNASACTASGAWSGTEPISGSVSTGALNVTADYSLTCTGPGGASVPQSVTVTVGAGPSANTALFNRITYNYSSTLTIAQEAARYQVLDMQSTNANTAQQLEAANPSLKVLMYQESLVSNSADPSGLTTCTDYTTDSNNANAYPGNPQYDWFLKDQNGNRVVEKGYPNAYLMDVGNSYYRVACAAHAISLAHAKGFNGVYFDDVSQYLSFYLNSGISIPAYPTNSGWVPAELSLTSYLGSQLHAASPALLVIANIGSTGTSTGGTFWQNATTPLDGSMEESWTDGGLGTAQQDQYWPYTLANAAWSEAHGKYVQLHSHNTTEAGDTYGLASMMLIAGGHSSYSTSINCYTSCETWYPEYDTAQQLGAPTGAYFKRANGAYERDFANGVVLVNPSQTTISSFSPTPSGIYSGSGLTNVTAVTLGADQGLILLKQ